MVWGEDFGIARDLIEQRLKEVMIRPHEAIDLS